MIRKATEADIPAVAEIYEKIHALEGKRFTTGWLRGIYPVEATARAALGRDDLFVYDDDGRILASAIINKTQVDVYADCKWTYEAADDEVMVLHTLTVDPDEARRGIGAAMVRFYEAYAVKNACRVLRLDTNAINTVARKMYARLGYTEVGTVPCVFNGIPDVMLVCMEKGL